jgi:membrane dipeptidase
MEAAVMKTGSKMVVCLLFVAALAVVAAARQKGPDEDAIVNKARAIHGRALTMDTHIDIAGPEYATPALDPGIDNPKLKCDLVKMNKGGLKGAFLAVFVGQQPELNDRGYKAAYDQAIAKFDAIHRLTEKMYPDRCALAVTPADVLRIARTGKRVIMIGVENGYPVGTDLGNLKKFYDLGARYLTLSHSGHNQICDSSGVRQPMHNGLSEFGKRVVAEMNRLGMMIDVSHIAEKSFYDVIAASKAPIIASHSGCSALNPVDRNLTDDQLRALSRNGGVVQVVALGIFLKAESPERREATQAKVKDFDAKYPAATVVDYVNHIDHAVKIAGIDHVGIGTDFDGGGGISGFNDHSEAFNVTLELVRRGYTERDIDKIWGGNLLRVWTEVEKISRQQQPTR